MAQPSKCSASLLVLLISPILFADTATYRQGDPDPFTGETYQGAADVMLVQNNDAAGQTDQNYGGRNRFFVGGATGQTSGFWPRRVIMGFDVSSLQGRYGRISSVTVRLAVSESANSGTLQVFRFADANAGWVEGTETGASIGDPPDVGMSTWNNRIQGLNSGDSMPWAGMVGAGQSGVDYEDLLFEFSYDSMTAGFIDLDLDPELMNELINDWTCGTNAGLFLRVEGPEIDNEIRFHSKEADEVADRPQLIIDYDPILIGDVNLDGVINLLDVAPFVQTLTDGVYLPNADINMDCSVDLLDVAPFVDLLAN